MNSHTVSKAVAAYVLFVAVLLGSSSCGMFVGGETSFDENYGVTWGFDHAKSYHQGTEVQLSLDLASGAGFESKVSYGSGSFHMKIKLPGRNSAGVVTAFYLTSSPVSGHDELDIEFLGNQEGKPITLQTNIFINGKGDREQRFHLWFDPTADFHDYTILWNHHQVAFLVDNIPIRMLKNVKGIGYPAGHPLKVVGSLWNASWATDGGATPIDWSYAPFQAQFRDFGVSGCPAAAYADLRGCFSPSYWWNARQYWRLSKAQLKAYLDTRKRYMSYDYCSDAARYPTPPPECGFQ
ncbi:unnamed protein product [Linum trigynum]|uniref:Xyloglucan endotransglucosylase/hydrolase n=1 Tax=Linum trigynum TaxID=586398 RepID=A0AAV2D0F0_9ROSI